MKRAAVFFDRDNTLIVSDGYLGDAGKVVLIEGAANAVAKARQYGFKVLTFSNQSGVARGMFDEAAVRAVNARLDELLAAANPAAKIVAHKYCPDHPEATVAEYRRDTPRRKPGPGMLLEAADEHNLDLSRSWVIGDAPRDIEAGHAAGCRTIFFRDPNLPPSPAAEATSAVTPDFVAASLKDAVELIGRESMKQPPKVPPPPRGGTGILPVSPKSSMGGSPMSSSDNKQDNTGEPPQAEDTDEPPSPPKDMGRMPMPRPDTGEPPVLRRAVESDISDSDLDDADDAPSPLRRRGGTNAKVQQLLMQILLELKRQRTERNAFSVLKLLAGIAQVLAATLLAGAFFKRHSTMFQPAMLYAIAFQAMTIALLLIGRQK